MIQKLLKRKAWSNESGVSDIIGNILILMITVVLFTSIMMFVNQMPVPEITTKADFSATLTFDDGGSTATLTITHIGGETMAAAETLVLVSIDDLTYSYRLSEDVEFAHTEWGAGVQWIKEYSGTTYSSAITVTIVDDVSHNAVWVSTVSGGMGLTPPNILQRYVDSNTGTLSIDPVKANDDFTLFVKISDLDNDLADVWVDNRSLPNGVAVLAPTRPSTVSPEGGWFEWDFTGVTNEVTDVDGKVLIIYAEDAAGHTTIVPFKLTIIVLPTDIDYYPADQTPQEGGMPSYIKNINEGQGFAVFSMNESSGTANISDPTTQFDRGDTVFVRAASMYVNNLDGANSLTLRDGRSGVYYTFLVTWYGLSDAETPFYNYAYGGNVFVYECAFTTTGLIPGTYLMHCELSCTGAVDYSFLFDETLYIFDEDSPMDYYPAVWISRDSSFDPCWGYSKDVPFNATGTNYEMYVGIAVQDAQPSPEPSVGEIRIVDMTGGTELYGPPESGDMIGAVTASGNLTAYYFTIDLRYSNGDAWKLGTNSYTLQISQFSDENEGVYAYSLQVFVRAPSSRSDFFVGTNGIYSSLGGSTNFINPEYVYHIENNNFFTMRTLYQQENAPSTSPLYYQNAMALGDLDNDGDLDLLVGSNMDNSGSYPNLGRILYFENTLNTYGTWQSPAVITRPTGDTTTTKIKWIDTGDINGDGYTDFAYITTEDKVWVFNNTYGAQGTQFVVTTNSTNNALRKVALEDMTGDGCADLILLKEGMVRMYDLTKWRHGNFANIPNPDVTSACNIVDFDIADMNNDGMLDVVTVDASSSSHADIQGVWVNNYTEEVSPDVKSAVDHEQYSGTITGAVSDTYATDGTAIILRENDTDEADPQGSVSVVFEMDTLDSYTDPLLCVNAEVSADNYEVYYVWYGTGANAASAKYTPVMVISANSYTNYTYAMPSTVAGQTVYVKITDSSTAVGDVIEEISIDYIAILSDRFGTYWPNPAISPSNRYQVTDLSVGETYTAARAINFDGLEDDQLEVACAKNGKFAVYDLGTAYATWTVSDSYMYVRSTSTVGLTVCNAISPTMFQVEDVNGDGYDDIVTTCYSTGASNECSVIKLYVNVGYAEDPWVITVKDVFSSMVLTAEKGSIVCVAVGDIFQRT